MGEPAHNILLLTDVFPCDNYSGALVSSQLCRFLLDEKKYNLFCACVKNPEVKEKYDDYLNAKIKRLDFVKPTENAKNTAKYIEEVTAIAKSISNYISKNHIDIIWCPMQGETLLRILDYIQKHNQTVFTSVQIWDPFEWILHDLKYPDAKKTELTALFDKVIKKSNSIITASRPMNEYYSKKYNIPCQPVFASYTMDNLPAKKQPLRKDIFTIVISGQTYAKRGINSLLKYLDSINWSYNNKKIVIKYFGLSPQVFKNHKNHVILGGYVTQAELIEAQSSADLLYCSYFFDDAMLDIVSKQSYPSKIITYIPSKTPIFIHAEEDCPVYQDFSEYKCGFLLNSTDLQQVKKQLEIIFKASPKTINTITGNSLKLFNAYFTPEQNKKAFFKALGLKPQNITRKHILEINNLDLPGRLWNGYDIMNHINESTPDLAVQLCTYKTSNNDNAIKIYPLDSQQELEYKLLSFEDNVLSVHSCLSSATPAILNKKVYQNADLVHFHLIHNTKLSFFSLIEMCNKKPSIISIHDPWNFTGHCVHFGDCNFYLTGCHKCPHLDAMFPIKNDNSHELWKLKKLVYDHIDVDYVVSTQYMYNLFKKSPLTKGKRVHVIPFGIDIHKFSYVAKKQARQKYHIPDDHIVLFHRAQKAFKGTNFFVDALKQLDTDQKVSIITCGEQNLLNEVKSKYKIIDLGIIEDDELAYAYNACDIFIMPSIGESFGMMAVEAMSCGKPVICFNNTALPSVVFAPECGIAAENLNSTKLMLAIKHLIEDSEDRKRRSLLAKKIVKDNYDIKLYYQRIDNLYKEVLSRKRKIYQTPSTKTSNDSENIQNIKNTLNKLTKKIFPPQSEQYEKLLYKTKNKKINKNLPIKYGDLETQILLDEYNKKCFDYYNTIIENNYHDPHFYMKIIKYAKIFSHLIINDRKKLIKLIRKRLRIK